MPPFLTSMAQDYQAGRPLEVEPILGNVVPSGQARGVPIPTLEALYAVARLVQEREVTSAAG